MKITKLVFISILLSALSSVAVFAKPPAVKHKHGERTHTHVLPNGQVNHQHGGANKNKTIKQKPNTTSAKKPTIPLHKMQALLRSLMKDPQAARFGKWWLGQGLPETGPQWCGFVNGKNSYGAYTGDQLYIGTTNVTKQFSFWMNGACKPVK